MNLPRVKGVIRRRLLVNFRVDPEVMSRHLPRGLTPKLKGGCAIAGICLIRLEQIRLPTLPLPIGLSSENAAHRIAVVAPDGADAVYVPRRDSDSWLNHLVGGRLFPGLHHRARFKVDDDGSHVRLMMKSVDAAVSVEVVGSQCPKMPDKSVFGSVDEASNFFEAGSVGYSATRDPERYDALVLETENWCVHPLDVSIVRSSYFEDREAFPSDSATFDHALVMRDVQHEWRSAPEYRVVSTIERAS